MAGLALRRKAIEDPRSRLLVAVFALNRGMRPNQRKSVLVIFHLLRSDRPALHGVTLLAIRSHLSAMHIAFLVTIGAVLADVLEHRLHMACNALHFFVHAAKRIVRFVVIEFRHFPNGFPTGGRVAVLARNGERPVRIARDLILEGRR